jgi:protein-arginine kinase activator protein McsA
MAFKKKILEKTVCPRCANDKAELRMDIHKPDSEAILVYLVCNLCHLRQYSFSTTEKAVKVQTKINKIAKVLSTLPPSSERAKSIRKQISLLREKRTKYETGV